MVRGHGDRWSRQVRLWLWLVIAGVLALRSGVEAQGELAGRAYNATVIANLTSYEQTIQEAAYAAFARLNPATGITYDANLTGELANVTVQAVRLRVGSLRRYGVTIGRFTIPPGLQITNASSVRVILVYRDFGNVSVYSSAVPGQVFVSSLAGIKLYNGDRLSSTTPLPPLTAIAFNNPIQVIIPPNAQPSYCVEFVSNGTAFATNVTATNVTANNATATNGTALPTYACITRTLGDNYFALVALPPQKKKSNTWKIILGTVLGVVGLIAILLLLVFCCRRQLRNRRLAKMREKADRGETLQPTVVGSSRAPVATQTRTRPKLERDLNVT